MSDFRIISDENLLHFIDFSFCFENALSMNINLNILYDL